MRFRPLLSSVSCLVFVSSLAVTYRQDVLAEQQFKNIKVFKGKKASDIIPSMQFMCSSLKVECDYCHVEDRASDVKDEKITAREMVLMQNDINQKNFHGRTVVTCATCHAGHTHPVNVPPVIGAEARPRRTKDVTVAQIFDSYNKAESAIVAHPIQNVTLIGVEVLKGETKPAKVTISGKKFFVETESKTRFQKVGYNGADLWFGTPKGPFTIPSQYATSFINQETIALGPTYLPTLTNTAAATAQVEGRDALVVMGTVDGSMNRASIYFDKVTALPVRVVYSYPTILGNIPQVNDYSDYKKVGGILIPMTVSHHSSEEDSTLHFKAAKLNGKIDEKIFEVKK